VEKAAAESSAVALGDIKVRSKQPRRHFDEGALASLTQSIRDQGVLQPVLLRRAEQGYELIAGERRVRAARLAGLQEIPALVREVSEEQADLLAILENLQREDLNLLDEVEAVITLIARELGIPEEEVVTLLHTQRRTPQAEVVEHLERVFTWLGRGTWRSFATNKATVLRFPPELLDLLRQGRLEYTRAAVLARVKDSQIRSELIQRALTEQLSVRELTALSKLGGSPANQYRRVRSLLEERRVALLDEKKRKRVQELLNELESLFGSV